MTNLSFPLPPSLSELMSAYDEAEWETEVVELTPNKGVLTRGTVLSVVAGKLSPTIGTTEATSYGILLDPAVNTVPLAAEAITASVARKGSFRGPALLVGLATNPALLVQSLRDVGIFVHGPITVPTS